MEYIHTYTGQNWSVHRSALRHYLISLNENLSSTSLCKYTYGIIKEHIVNLHYLYKALVILLKSLQGPELQVGIVYLTYDSD